MVQILSGLKPESYEHVFDREKLAKIKAVPLVPNVVNYIMNWTVVKWKIVSMCGSNFHVTRSACPDLYKILEETFQTLDLKFFPELYVEQDYYINAYTTGHNNDAFIVLGTGAVDKLTTDELRFVIGHECGHIKSGHVVYHLMCTYFNQLLGAFSALSSFLASVTLYKWVRMSEFTADRAGLLACQDLDTALSAIMKSSGLPEKSYKNASVEGFKQQIKEFEDKYGSTTDTMIKYLTIFDEDHPWTIVRAAELIKWVESGEYQKVIDNVMNGRKQCPLCKRFWPTDTIICPVDGYHFK